MVAGWFRLQEIFSSIGSEGHGQFRAAFDTVFVRKFLWCLWDKGGRGLEHYGLFSQAMIDGITGEFGGVAQAQFGEDAGAESTDCLHVQGE